MRRRVLALSIPAAAILATLPACATAPRPRPADAAVSIACTDASAQIYLDEVYAGLCAASRARPLPLVSGFHRVEVRAPGRFSAYRELRVARGERATLSVSLRPDLDSDGPP